MDIDVPSLLAALALASLFALKAGAREEGDNAFRKMAGHRRWISAAAGVSVAYVFVDILPELGEQNAVMQQATEGARLFAEQRIYVLALLSFVVMYGIDHIVLSGRSDARRASVERGESDAIYRLHLGGFAAYGALIGYLLVERAERGHVALAVYGVAMAIHFFIVSHSLAEEHGRLYRERGHWLLAASVVAGWAVGTSFTFTEATFARLFALLAGGVVITSLGAELPDDRDGRFWPFCAGAVLFAIVLLLA